VTTGAPKSARGPVLARLDGRSGDPDRPTGAAGHPRWHLDHGISAIPKSVKTPRIAKSYDVFDFTLTIDDVAAIDALGTA
jgi:hypothetical protein